MSFLSGVTKGVFNTASGGILKMVVSQVTDVIGDITQGQKMLQELVHTPIQGIIKEVTGGMWTGEGANKFVGELNSSYVPGVQGIGEQIGGMIQHVSTAVDTLQQADKKAATLVNDLATEFEMIYKG